jgi:hypothetical protein
VATLQFDHLDGSRLSLLHLLIKNQELAAPEANRYIAWLRDDAGASIQTGRAREPLTRK